MALLDKEKKEIPERHGVIFVAIRRQKIQLERRGESGDKFQGFIIVPGGKVEAGETLEIALKREFMQEYGAKVSEYRKLGTVVTREPGEEWNIRHVYRVSKWRGRLGNPERRNLHLEASLPVARLICKHPLSQEILDLVESDLSGKH